MEYKVERNNHRKKYATVQFFSTIYLDSIANKFAICMGIIMNKILIVVDMQNDFIDGSLGTEEAQGIVGKVIDKIKSFHGQVIYTRDTHYENYLDSAEGKKLPVKHCIKGTEGWLIQKDIEKLRTDKNELVFDKITFGSKDLVKYIAENMEKMGGISEIELCGLCTDICVISNAIMLKAFLPEVPIVIDSSCCAGVTPDSHQNALETMKMCHLDII